MPANPDPNCPHCRGTGRIELFTGTAPCECTERSAEPSLTGASPLTPYLESLAAIGPDAWKKQMFGEWPTEPEPKPADRPLVFSERTRIAEEAMAWLDSRTTRFASHNPLSIVTALDALGYLRRKPVQLRTVSVEC